MKNTLPSFGIFSKNLRSKGSLLSSNQLLATVSIMYLIFKNKNKTKQNKKGEGKSKYKKYIKLHNIVIRYWRMRLHGSRVHPLFCVCNCLQYSCVCARTCHLQCLSYFILISYFLGFHFLHFLISSSFLHIHF
jgi:hypothetical protein